MEDLRLHDAVLFLAVAGLVIPAVRWLRVSAVLGFLITGLVLGPHGLGRLADTLPWLGNLLITDVAGVMALAELGVVFLLFMIGLELAGNRLWSMRRQVFGLGSAQILVSALVIGGIAFAFGNAPEASILLGACLALSSTAIVMQMLIEQGRFGEPVGQGCFAVLLAQDVAVVPVLFLVGALGSQSNASLGWELGGALLQAVIAIALILGIGRLVLRPLFRFVAGSGGPEMFMALTLLTILATAAITHAAGLSAALGAFLAGLVLAEGEYRHEIEVSIEPFKGLLLGLFFMSIGMGIDLAAVAMNPLWIGLSVVGLIGVKALVTAGLARAFGFGWGPAAEMGLLLGQGGEFAFVVVALAVGLGLLPPATAQFMLIVVSATMFATPLVARLARGLGRWLDARGGQGDPQTISVPADLAGHVIIVGYGRTGALLARLLDRQQIQHAALELDADQVKRLRNQGASVFLGDASRAATLRMARLGAAAAVVVCIDDFEAAGEVVHAVRREAPHIPIVARSRDPDHAAALIARGASRVVPELVEAGLQLGQALLEQVGLTAGTARDLVAGLRNDMEGDPADRQ
jgi:CPA2 family monovalent cation:H+ antiporter-2